MNQEGKKFWCSGNRGAQPACDFRLWLAVLAGNMLNTATCAIIAFSSEAVDCCDCSILSIGRDPKSRV